MYDFRVTEAVFRLKWVICAAPIASAGVISAMSGQWQVQREADKAAAEATLKDEVTRCLTFDIDSGPDNHRIATCTLPPEGGASGAVFFL